MNIKHLSLAAATVLGLAFSSAWAAETPEPGKTREETATNRAKLICRGQTPLTMLATYETFAGLDPERTREKMRQQFDADGKAGKYYTTIYEQEKWIDNTIKAAQAVLPDMQPILEGLTQEEIRREVYSRSDQYEQKCTAGLRRIFLSNR